MKQGPIGAEKLADFKKGDRGEMGKKGSIDLLAGIFFFECRACWVCKFLLREFSVLML